MGNGNDLVIRKGVLKSCKGNPSEVIIPEGVLEIGKDAFRGRDNLSKVVIPEGVKVIGECAFFECRKLSEVVLPDSLEIIGDGAFGICPLKSITIPERVTEIGGYAFCTTQIKKIVIPQNVKSIGSRAFGVHAGLANVGLLSEVDILGSEVTLGKNVFSTGGQVMVFAPNAPLSLFAAEYKRQIIFTYLMRETGYPQERIDEYKKYIDKTDDLISLLIEQGQTAALSKLLQLKSKVKLEKLDAFLEQAQGNAEMEAALLAYKARLFQPADIEKIEERKTDVELGIKTRTVTEWKKLFGFEKSEKGLIITAYKGEETIVEVPEMIGKDAVIAIGESAFSPFVTRVKNKDARRALRQVILPDTVKEIGNCAFKYCGNLESIVLPDSVVKIGDRAFENCTSLTSIAIPSNIKKIDRVFLDCTKLTRAVFSNGVTAIGFIFSGCTNLSEVTIPASVTSIDRGAFYRCTKVTIKAPAGSYAETYAKEHNIPFVAE